MVVAIEPFATDGAGRRGRARRGRGVPRWTPASRRRRARDAEVLEAIRALHGLPFARRQLAALDRGRVEETLRALAGGAAASPPTRRWWKPADGAVAQAEHTLYVGPDGVEVLTR